MGAANDRCERDAVKTFSGLAWMEVLLAVSVLSLVLQLAWPSIMAWWHRPRAGYQVPALFAGPDGTIRYLIYLPEEYGQGARRWPLLLFLHGAGQRGADLMQVKKLGPPALLAAGQPMPMLVVSPQCRENASWQAADLVGLLGQVEKTYRVDVDRIYLTGYSMGGCGAWELATLAPERFAALVPVSGSGNPGQAGRLVHLPVWAFHGARDKAVSPANDKKMIAAMSQLGGQAKLTLYPERGHGICDLVYRQPELFTWLLKQKRAHSE